MVSESGEAGGTTFPSCDMLMIRETKKSRMTSPSLNPQWSAK